MPPNKRSYMLKLTIRRILPAIVLLLSSATSHALDFEDGNFTFSTNDDGTNTCTITGTKLSSGGLTIPSTASNNGSTYTVTQIGADAFRHKQGLTGSLIIPEGITRIGMMAFIGCSGFTELKLPKGLKIIESMAFYECNGFTGELQIPEGIELIDQHAFEHCSRFSTLILPEGLTSIGDMTFIGCSGLTEIKLPEGLKSIGGSVFAGCSGLTEIKFPEGLTSIGYSAFSGCSGLTGELLLPEGLTKIESYTFKDCTGLTELNLPEGLKSIESSAFEGCSGLTELKLPEGLTNIGISAFANCSGLTGELLLPEGLTNIESYTFQDCSGLTEIKLPEGLTYIENNAFKGCIKLTGLKLPEGIQSIGRSAFEGCSGLTGELLLPGGLTSIGSSAFKGCIKLTGLKLPEKLQSIGGSVFEGCSGLTGELQLPEGLIDIRTSAFEGCSGLIGELILPENLKWIEDRAFYGCTGLTGITLYKSFSAEIHYDCFYECTSIESIISFNPTPITLVTPLLQESSKEPKIYVPAQSIDDYKQAPYWNQFTNYIGIRLIVDPESLSIHTGSTTQLAASVTPEEITDKITGWSSSDESVATIDPDGMLTAIKAGETTITVTTEHGLSAECKVTVTVQVTAVDLDRKAIELTEGESTQLVADITPDNATDKSIEWSSSDNTIATVDADGLVTALIPGTATITATSANGLKASCLLTVKAKPIVEQSITLNHKEATVEEGASIKLEATILPDNTTDKSVAWSSSDNTIATVDANGLVTALIPGAATITATSANGLKASCKVTVKAKPIVEQLITLNHKEATVDEGASIKLEATILPDDTTDKSVTWSSSDNTVATVDADGLVTALIPGTATITATSANGLKASCELTVKAKPIVEQSITLNHQEATVEEGASIKLEATILPYDTTDKSVTWSSSDNTVATVDQNGSVTAIAVGTATITATSANGLKASCELTVKAKQSGINGIHADDSAITIDGNNIILPDGGTVYDITGRKVTPTSLRPGIYIVRLRNGKALKVRI